MKSFVSFICITVLIFEVWCDDLSSYYRLRRSTCPDCRAPRIKVPPKNSTVAVGETKTLQCRADGKPIPTIRWKKNDAPLDQTDGHYKVTTKQLGKRSRKYRVVKSTLEISDFFNKDFGIYTCEATNAFGSVSQSAFVIFNLEAVGDPRDVPGSIPHAKKMEQCIPYINSSTCAKYLDPTMSVYIDTGETSFFMRQNFIEGLAKNLESTDQHLSDKCKPFALPFLCYYNFPYCRKSNKPEKKTICRADCTRLSVLHCGEEFRKAKDDEVLRTLIPSSCSKLPNTNCYSMKEEMEAVARLRQKSIIPPKEPNTRVTDGHAKPKDLRAYIDPRDNCFYDEGREYRGIENKTRNNRDCMSWSLTDARNNPHLIGHNYCRNLDPNNIQTQPWCYVRRQISQGLDTREIELCEIPQCAIPVRSQTSSILYTIIPCLLFALILSLAIIAFAWRKHKRSFYHAAPTSCKQVVPRVNPKIQELNREDLCDYRLLGDGNIGRVYTADYTGTKDGRTLTSCVAVKAIIDKATSKQIEDFVREAETRVNFKHENVVKLIGVISKEEPLSLIYEYTEFSDLHEYLLRHSPNFSDAHANDDCAPLQYNDLLVIATQIANGMSYLSSHAFVHKDLAARNCLVDNGIIKISDFSGLCDQYAGDYLRVAGRPPLPVRWMAPESLSKIWFSTAGDIYSYGVLLWEIFSYGSRPYFGLNNQQAMNLILDYKLLSCPDGCPNIIFDVMTECWFPDEMSRPSFGEIYNKLKSLNEITKCPSSMLFHPQSSMHSLPTTHTSGSRRLSRDLGQGDFQQASFHEHSVHSKQGSNHSVNNGHLHGVNYAVPTVPTSLINMPPHSILSSCSMSGHSLPHDVHHHSMQLEKRQSPHGGNESVLHSLQNNLHHMHHEGHYPTYPHDDFRPSSASSRHHSSMAHSNVGGILPPASYISSLHSYPSSNAGPPACSFSRTPDSCGSSRATSIKSHDSQRFDNASSISHIYL